jgi:hypothetical protein
MAIIVEFVGGFRDGTRASTASDDPAEAKFALMKYHFSNQGEIGKKHQEISVAAQEIFHTEGVAGLVQRGLEMNHFYKVVSKTIEGDDTIVRFQSVGQDG